MQTQLHDGIVSATGGNETLQGVALASDRNAEVEEWTSPESSPGELTGVVTTQRAFIPGRQWSRDQVALWLVGRVGRWCGGSDPARACAGGGGRLTAPRLRARGQLVGCGWSRVAVQWPLQDPPPRLEVEAYRRLGDAS